ncbi:MAG TPA: PA4780 family RIO1-like protein kinase [Verrucomicrobiae bacterium]|nr:PA4780 family RIO1-like protein kinase [Verrucomicrobiae bacterium]
MKTPKGLQPLLDDGAIDAVLGALKSGKEASVYLVACGSTVRCAKVYKDAGQRGFHKMAQYQEGRRHRGSREQRAMGKRSRFGREEQESAWKNAEVEALFRLYHAGVRVPKPVGVYEGVLLMEVVTDAEGRPAPRLNDVGLEPEQAREWYAYLVRQVVKMLCAGMIHGDLSEYNVLASASGPVIIDLPQAVDATGNNNAYAMLERDVVNLRNYFSQFAPELAATEYAPEIWKLFVATELKPDTPLTGRFVHDTRKADVGEVLYEIGEARKEAELREAGRLAAEQE